MTMTQERVAAFGTAALTQFRDAIQAAGMTPPDVIEADGKLRRFSGNGKPKDDAGWYVLHGGAVPAGIIGDHRTGLHQNWRADIGRTLTPAEDAVHRAKVEAMKLIRKAEETRRRTDAAKKAAAIWKAAAPAGADHPYLARKQVAPVDTLREIGADAVAAILGYTPKSSGEALTGRVLVAPIKIVNALSSCELIDGDGRKSAISGGAKAAGYWAAQALPDGDGAGLTLFIAEGVATTLSVAQASGQPTIAALSSGNLATAAKAMRKRYPAAVLVLAADLVKVSGAPDPHAADAAQAVAGLLAAPDFGDDRAESETDFNDMAVRFGLDAVRRCIEAAIHGPAGDAMKAWPDDTTKPAPPAAARKKAARIGSDSMTCSYGGGTFDVSKRGVFFIGTDKDGNEQPPRWICSPLDIIAKTRDAKSGEWGRLLEWRDDDQVRHQWAMPLELLQSDGTDMRRELARMGLTISPVKAARDLLAAFIQVWKVETLARCVERLGWHGAVYVTPSESIGQENEIVVFQNAHAIEPAFAVAGTAEEWRSSVAALSAGNSRLVFALSVAFAGALADVAGEDSGGFHLRGGSSSGKTTALKVAASVWGDPNTYPRLWRATANGLEGLAALHNDGLLILDELSQIDPKEAGEAAYLLANGQGKARASRTGAARQSARWRLLFLSAGEESLTALMARVGKKANAGQEIRLADIDADAGAGMGAFEVLHDQPSPAALALAVKDAAIRNHGAVGLAWLRCIVADRADLAETIAAGIKCFVEDAAPTNAAGQVLRVARRFALVAMAGELATHYALTGWNKGEAIKAAHKCFAAWLDSFGGTGNREERNILSQVRAFFEAHGASRFEDMSATSDQRIINRAGFYRSGPAAEREYLVLPEAFKRDVCQGFDTKVATAAMVAAKWIEPGKDGRDTQKPRIPGIGPTRCYVFTARMWEGEEG
ncbi:uncharacterized protein (DUF927 family)/phage/plasmid primase-like uncharacterized protein [Oxalobacteraceae bacterium GrIS 1.11]